MTPEQYLRRLAFLATQVDSLHTDIDWDNVDEHVDAWDQLDRLHGDLMVLIRQHSVELAAKLPLEYLHPRAGVIHTTTETRVAWDGAGVLEALTENLIDPNTGEIVPAVATTTLSDVIPAAKQGRRSSKWSISGLRAAGVDPDEYRATSFGDRLLRRGPKYVNRSHPTDTRGVDPLAARWGVNRHKRWGRVPSTRPRNLRRWMIGRCCGTTS